MTAPPPVRRRSTAALARTLGTAALLTLAAGCAAVHRAREAQDPRSAVPGERTPTAAEAGIPTTGTIRLDDAVRWALAIHPSVLRVRRNEEAAAARVSEAGGALLPQSSVSASKQYRDQKASGGVPVEHRFESLGFQVSWLLFDFGHASATVRKAAADWLSAQADARTTDAEVAFGVRSAYFTLVKDLHLLEVAKEAVAQFDEHLAQVREFVRVGTRIPYDETKAEVDAGNARLALVQAEDAALLAQAELANALGLAETTDWVPEPLSPQPPMPPTFEECWARAKKGRPSIASAAAREEAASFLIDAQVAALYPSLSLGFGWSASGPTTPLPWSWQAGGSLSWVPFDGFQRLATIDEATAGLKAARADRALAEQQAWLDTRSAFLAVEDAKRRVELTGLVVRSAEENVRLALGRFEVGKGTTVELTDAQQALTKARADAVQAQADGDIAAARMLRALGETGRKPREDEPPPGRKP